MAEIRDDLILEIDQALRQIDRVRQALDRAFAATDIRIDDTSIRQADRALQSMADSGRDVSSEMAQVAQRADAAEVDFRQLAQALNVSEQEAAQLADEILQARQRSVQLESASRDVARQLDLSEDEARRFTQELRAAGRATESIESPARAVTTHFSNMRTVVAGITGAIAALGIGRGIAALSRQAGVALREFQALNESVNAVQVTFGTASRTIIEFGEISARAAGLSAQAFQQAVVPIGSVLRNFGFDAQAAARASIDLVQRAADLASVFNTDVSDALAAMSSALVGQVEPLRRYGAEISQARVAQEAMALGLIRSASELDTQAAVAARVSLILKDTSRVQGDFANTSDQLANATRVAKAEAQEFASSVGEQLAPAAAAVVAILPDLLEGVRQLVPTFAAAADSAAAFFASLEEGGGGFRAPFQAVSAGLGEVGDLFLAATDIVSTAFDTLTFEFERADEQMEQFNQRLENTAQRIAGQFLAQSLDAGTDSATAFANAIANVAQETSGLNTFRNSYRAFAIQANLSGPDLARVTRFLIENREQAGLTAEEVDFLRHRLALLSDTLFGNIDALRQQEFELSRIPDVASDTANAFQVISERARESGTSIADTITQLEEAARGGDDAAQALLSSVDSFDRFNIAMASTRESARATAAALREQLVGGFTDAADGIQGAVEEVEITAREFTDNLVASEQQLATFGANLITLAAQFPALAQILEAEGPRAAAAAAGFIEDLDLAQAAEDVLTGQSTAIAGSIQAQLLAAAGEVEGDTAALEIMAQIASGLESQTAQNIINEAIATLLEQSVDPRRNFPNFELAGRRITQDLARGVGASRRIILDALVGSSRREFLPEDDLRRAAEEAGLSVPAGFSSRRVLTEVDRARDQIADRFAAFDTGDRAQLERIGTEQALSVVRGMFNRQVRSAIDAQAQRLADAIETAIRRANQLRSPSPLYMAIGEELADSIMLGFAQSDLQVRSSAGSIQGRITSTPATPAGSPISVTLVNTTTPDLETAVARTAQVIGAVGGLVNRARTR